MTAIDELLDRARVARRKLAASSTEQRNRALEEIALVLREQSAAILTANDGDVRRAREGGLASAMLDRLMLDAARLEAVIRATREVAALPDPLAEQRQLGVRPNGLRISKQRIPLGVLAVIYEARPNVTVEAATLAIKSGNAIVLRGGREAIGSNRALATAVRSGLERAGLNPDAVAFVDDPARERVVELLGATGKVDLVIPRGGHELMKLVDAHARVPVIRHGQGITHLFVDATADLAMAAEIVFNAKVQRPGVCNALETLLVHESAIERGAVQQIAARLQSAGVELRADASIGSALERAGIPFRSAQDPDWDTEFLALVIAMKAVRSLDEALDHIAVHGSQHTAVIVTESQASAERFLREVDAACVLWNASSRFNDGGELGLGAEIGISTSKMHAFGPMGLRELTAEKFVVQGSGQVRG